MVTGAGGRAARRLGLRPFGRRAFTMIEMLLTASLMGLLVTFVAPLITQSSTFLSVSVAKIEVTRDARNCLDFIVPLLEKARPSSISITSPAGAPPYSRLAFTTIDGRSYVISQSRTELLVSENGGAARLLSKNLDMATFIIGQEVMTEIGISLLMEKSALGRRTIYSQQYNETVHVMNAG